LDELLNEVPDLCALFGAVPDVFMVAASECRVSPRLRPSRPRKADKV